jgi:hypothetical protein
MKVKRYVVFGSESYYPGGGWSDFVESFDDFDQAVALADSFVRQKHPEIIDLETGEDLYVYSKNRIDTTK